MTPRDQFRQLRVDLGLTQSRLASLLRVSIRSVRNWENGTFEPPYVAIFVLETIKSEKSK